MRKTRATEKNSIQFTQAIDAAEEPRRTLAALGKVLAACREEENSVDGKAIAQIGELIVAEIRKIDEVFNQLSSLERLQSQ